MNFICSKDVYTIQVNGIYIYFLISQKFKKKTLSRIFADYFFLKLKTQILIQKTA